MNERRAGWTLVIVGSTLGMRGVVAYYDAKHAQQLKENLGSSTGFQRYIRDQVQSPDFTLPFVAWVIGGLALILGVILIVKHRANPFPPIDLPALPPTAAGAVSSRPTGWLAAELAELTRRHKDGLVTQEEYEASREDLLWAIDSARGLPPR